MGHRYRVLLVDDHHLLLEGLQLALRASYDIVGMLTTGGDVLSECLRLDPDVVLLDLSLPDRSGLEVIADLHAATPGIKILVVTMHADRVLADACFQSGAHGFVPKDAGTPELKRALAEVLTGKRFVSSLIPQHTHRYSPEGAAVGLGRLTPRQREIVRLLGEGKSTPSIAEQLSLSPNTVTFHRVRIRKALGLNSEWTLMRYAFVVRMSEEERG
jgi:DNA-binding NarL/FixJ family response regulator